MHTQGAITNQVSTTTDTRIGTVSGAVAPTAARTAVTAGDPRRCIPFPFLDIIPTLIGSYFSTNIAGRDYTYPHLAPGSPWRWVPGYEHYLGAGEPYQLAPNGVQFISLSNANSDDGIC